MRRESVPEGIRLTKVGLWFILLTLVVGVAAANTGNNALYMVEAVLLSVLVLSGLASRRNLRRLVVDLDLPDEVYANQPFPLTYSLSSRDRWLPRRLVALRVHEAGDEVLVPFLGRGERTDGILEMMVPRRGTFVVPWAHLFSLFPFGFFRKGLRLRLDHEMLVFPEIFAAGRGRVSQVGQTGDRPSARAGWGHELWTLRTFQPGDDRRTIHWKQTARTGRVIVMEREAERGRRVSIVLDNAVGDLDSEAEERRFERLVSEAATAAHFSLERGDDVELVTRDARIPFGGGRRHRRRILRELALIVPRPRAEQPLLVQDPSVPRLRLAMDPEVRA